MNENANMADLYGSLLALKSLFDIYPSVETVKQNGLQNLYTNPGAYLEEIASAYLEKFAAALFENYTEQNAICLNVILEIVYCLIKVIKLFFFFLIGLVGCSTIFYQRKETYNMVAFDPKNIRSIVKT